MCHIVDSETVIRDAVGERRNSICGKTSVLVYSRLLTIAFVGDRVFAPQVYNLIKFILRKTKRRISV